MGGHLPSEKKMEKKVPKKKGEKSDWMKHLDKVFKDGKKKNGDYKYKDAMKDAKKTYKKGGK